ncbi:carotenoid biosynthesis protein [Ferruginibacter yonginensis]|uniref:Carotenoid biosynthesis protein n=1 Tax=Ferruginibacter yonginensis TaxID=1310416 RepID=A0ABV8QR00_9BACT
MLKTKTQQATAVAILFHAIGLIGILFFDSNLMAKATPLNMLLMLGLLFYTQEKINTPFLVFFAVCFVTGIVVEIIGTSSGLLFGNYAYGPTLGVGVKNVPLLIGVNWFIIVYCCGVTVYTILQKLSAKLSEVTGAPTPAIHFITIVVDAAFLAVLFDWVLEPIAVKLGYWQWLGDGTIPFYNYVCWFVISAALLAVFNILSFNKRNIFAVNLLLIMLLFFMLLRTFL